MVATLKTVRALGAAGAVDLGGDVVFTAIQYSDIVHAIAHAVSCTTKGPFLVIVGDDADGRALIVFAKCNGVRVIVDNVSEKEGGP